MDRERQPSWSSFRSQSTGTNTVNNNSISDNWEDVNMTESDSVWDYCVNSSCVPTIDAEVDCIVNMQ